MEQKEKEEMIEIQNDQLKQMEEPLNLILNHTNVEKQQTFQIKRNGKTLEMAVTFEKIK